MTPPAIPLAAHRVRTWHWADPPDAQPTTLHSPGHFTPTLADLLAASRLIVAEHGRPHALRLMRQARITPGWETAAPPDTDPWSGQPGGWITWSDTPDDAPDGWATTNEDHCCDSGTGPLCAPAGALCLGLDAWDQETVDLACLLAPASVVAIAPGDGWPWLCRITGPVTIIDLNPEGGDL